jgi:polysaccharide pyruvyl transferase WcaK-like protein
LKLKYKKNSLSKTKEIFKDADFIFSLGLGDSFSDIYGKDRFQKTDLIHVLARKYKKPYCMLPQTIGPFNDEKVKEKAGFSIKNADMVMARDKQSFDYVINNVPSQEKIGEFIDVAFFMPYEKVEMNHDYINIGLNVSGLLWQGGYTHNNQFNLNNNYQDTVHRIIKFFLEKPNVKLHLVGHVVFGDRWLMNDYLLCHDLCKEYNNSRVILAPYFLGPIEAKNYIAGLDFFMGARMHATIAAFSARVPVVPMAYSRKFNGLFIDTLQYPHMVDLKSDDIETILDKVNSSYCVHSELKDKIDNRMDTIVVEREKLIEQTLIDFLKI